jgi:hypothetical protein
MTTEPEPTPEPDPDPPVFQPYLYYKVTARDDTETCVNYLKVFEFAQCYSNNGIVRIICAKCRHDMRLLTAELLDPQPEVS